MKSNLYTRTGDTGQTSLVGGERVDKDSERLEAYGCLDEFSSHLGLLASMPRVTEEMRGQLLAIQNELFNTGSYLATAQTPGEPTQCRSLTDGSRIATVEQWIDTLDEQTPKIRAFVLPGGCEESAQAHVCRTVCRRAERRVISLSRQEYVDPAVIRYLNRLSDYLFAAARYLNFNAGIAEIVWKQI